jgi:hypothetical protein
MIIQPRFHDCRISEYTYKGYTVLFLENRLLRIGVLLSKGADIMEFRYKPLDIDFLWHAPQDLLPLGNAVPTISSQKYGNFMDFFYGGWQESLPSGLGNVVYKNAEFGVHGEVSLLPWEAQVLDDTRERISVLFTVRTRRTPFRLDRTMTLEKDLSFLRIDEQLLNEGEEKVEYIWGHHPTFGPPFLEEGCIADFPGGKITTPPQAYCDTVRYEPAQEAKWPYILNRKNEKVRYDLVPLKETRTEDVSCISDFPEAWVALRNPRLGLGFFMVWDKEVFPYVWSWQAYGGSYGFPYYGRTYNWAIEPFSSPLLKLPENIEKGTVKSLGPKETVATTLLAGAFTGSEKVLRCSPDGSLVRQ